DFPPEQLMLLEQQRVHATDPVALSDDPVALSDDSIAVGLDLCELRLGFDEVRRQHFWSEAIGEYLANAHGQRALHGGALDLAHGACSNPRARLCRFSKCMQCSL